MLRRPGTDQDRAAVIALIGGCFAEYPGCVLDLTGIDAWMQAPGTAYAGSGAFWVVEDEAGDVVASVGWKPVDEHTAELKSLYVAASARRHGLGRGLVDVVERAVLGRGFTTVQLWSDSRFDDAHRLYERLGYVRGPQTRDLHDPSDSTEFFFTRVLPGV